MTQKQSPGFSGRAWSIAWPNVVGGTRLVPFVLIGAANAGGVVSRFRQGSVIPVKYAPSQKNNEGAQMITTQPDHVTDAGHIAPSRIFLRFGDGLFGTWTFDQLQLDMANMKPETVRPSTEKTSIEVMSKRNELVRLDSSALRYLVDPKYAAKIDEKLDLLASQIGL